MLCLSTSLLLFCPFLTKSMWKPLSFSFGHLSSEVVYYIFIVRMSYKNGPVPIPEDDQYLVERMWREAGICDTGVFLFYCIWFHCGFCFPFWFCLWDIYASDIDVCMGRQWGGSFVLTGQAECPCESGSLPPFLLLIPCIIYASFYCSGASNHFSYAKKKKICYF